MAATAQRLDPDALPLPPDDTKPKVQRKPAPVLRPAPFATIPNIFR
jgi:hypothetical protein